MGRIDEPSCNHTHIEYDNQPVGSNAELVNSFIISQKSNSSLKKLKTNIDYNRKGE